MPECNENQIKICRNCHTTYKKLTQKFCGNGCERNSPYLIDGKSNDLIEPREILLSPNPDNKVRWICTHCYSEYSPDEVNIKEFTCKKCKAVNDVYPFSFKACANCKDSDGTIHKLPLEAKACEICGKSEYILNFTKLTSELKANKSSTKDWGGPESVEFKPPTIDKPKDTNQLSLTLTLLNNNLEIKLFAENKTLTVKDLIRMAPGFVPDGIYEQILTKYPKEILQITYNDNQFNLASPMELQYAELNEKFQKKNPPVKWEASKMNPLPESKLLEFKGDFLKFQIWVF